MLLREVVKKKIEKQTEKQTDRRPDSYKLYRQAQHQDLGGNMNRVHEAEEEEYTFNNPDISSYDEPSNARLTISVLLESLCSHCDNNVT